MRLLHLLNLSASISSGFTRAEAQIRSTASPGNGFIPCDNLVAAGLGERLIFPSSEAYETQIETWWALNTRQRPWCLVLPQNSQEVSTVIKTLAGSDVGSGNWHVAIRSGGHGHPGTNNIDHGVTIDLSMMNNSWYDPSTGLASVEPGARWKDAYSDLLASGNVTVTGGRDGQVGAGGLLLGGGISYYAGLYGLSCDTVVNYEIVTADGNIINANASANADLWRALKGGGANFGVVTRYDMEAITAVDIAYGTAVLDTSYSDQATDFLLEFTESLETHRDDAQFTVYSHNSIIEGDSIYIVGTNVKGDINSSSFDKFNAIPAISREWSTLSLVDAANISQAGGNSLAFGTALTFSNVRPVLQSQADLHAELVTKLSSAIGAENFTTSFVLQPFPKFYESLGMVQNMLGIGRMKRNAISWTGVLEVTNGDHASGAIARQELQAMTEKLRQTAIDNNALEDLIYMNYADPSQDVLSSYGADNAAFIRQVAKKYDPLGFWQDRVPGGWKISKVF